VFNIVSPAATGVITESTHSIAITVPNGTIVTALIPTITQTGASISPASGVAQNFTNPVIYTVTAADASTQDYTVTVTVAASPAKAITAFSLNGVAGTINETGKTIAVTMFSGTDVTALVATFTTTGTSVKVGSTVQTTGTTANNFTSQVTYTVTAADASTQDYTVTVTVAASLYNFVTTWGSYGTGTGQFEDPVGVAVDTSKNVDVADNGNARIQAFSSSGTFITTWGSYGTGNGQFHEPLGIAVDASGNIYVADTENNRIQFFLRFVAFDTKWGSLGTGNGQFNQPGGVAVDASGNVYVADAGNNLVFRSFPRRGHTSPSGDLLGQGMDSLMNPMV
jgi:hypothetical protein